MMDNPVLRSHVGLLFGNICAAKVLGRRSHVHGRDLCQKVAQAASYKPFSMCMELFQEVLYGHTALGRVWNMKNQST